MCVQQSLCVQVPSPDADYGLDAAQFLSQATGGGSRMTASIERRERQQQVRGKDPLGSQPLLHVVLSKEGAGAAESVNADMLRAGLARVKMAKRSKVCHLQTSAARESKSGHVNEELCIRLLTCQFEVGSQVLYTAFACSWYIHPGSVYTT